MSRLRFFGFPYAGGGAHVLQPIERVMKDASLVAVDYPGHGRRMAERPVDTMADIVTDVATSLRTGFEAGDYGLYGHSMGAHVVAVLSLEIARLGLTPPRVAVVTGAASPTRRDDCRDHRLSDDAFLDKLRQMGGPAVASLASPEIVQLFLPILRADFRAIETYEWPKEARLGFPIIAACGAGDDTVTPSAFGAWRDVTEHECELHTLPGGHFFPFGEGVSQVAALIDCAARRFT